MILIRSLAFTLAFYLWSLIAAVIFLPVMIMPRRVAQGSLKTWGRVVTWLLRVVAGVRVEIRGRENVPIGAALVASKHQCMFDIFGTAPILPDGSYVLRQELMAIPVFSWWAAKCRMIVIDREGGAKSLRKLLADSRQRLKDDPDRQIFIFPEGTRGQPGVAGDYLPGVAALYRDLELPCVPIALNSGAHWPAHGIIRRPGTIVFEFLDPIPPGLKRAAFMETLETRLEAASNALLAEGL
ncbi:MAG TPA: lysophospholipid acyltransferase family protein [Caulobacteraceae bacterium]|nr:lysophospholipid acyltransferase family protein [Caulobacteraceae bacterium]